MLHYLFFLTFPKGRSCVYFLRDTISYIMVVNFCIFIFSVVFSYDGFFVSSMAKGIVDGFPLYKGIYSTPQILASMCLIYWISLYVTRGGSKYQLMFVFPLSIALCLLSFNRTIIACSIVIFLIGTMLNRSPKAILISILAAFFLVIVLVNFISYFNIETVNSRVALSEAVWDTIDMDAPLSILIGKQSPFSTMVNVGNGFVLSNVENGFLFVLRFFGISGVAFYVIYILTLMCQSFLLNKDVVYVLFIFMYFFIVQLITQEFVSVSFYIAMVLVSSINKALDKNEKNSVLSSCG
ncbi:hypothetical protein [Aeromonas caviae]|uniref:hypothetical protein n=1 Tax=Aeromonas caviae TaxID=648 RepID=UPI0021C2F905|nr:hypothetical protein [Aeromonas caviae]